MCSKCVNTGAHNRALLLNTNPTNQLLRKHWKDKQMVHNGEVSESYKHNIYKTVQKKLLTSCVKLPH